jgi:hypothetical protein
MKTLLSATAFAAGISASSMAYASETSGCARDRLLEWAVVPNLVLTDDSIAAEMRFIKSFCVGKSDDVSFEDAVELAVGIKEALQEMRDFVAGIGGRMPKGGGP